MAMGRWGLVMRRQDGQAAKLSCAKLTRNGLIAWTTVNVFQNAIVVGSGHGLPVDTKGLVGDQLDTGIDRPFATMALIHLQTHE